MINVAYLKPSDIEKLKSTVLDLESKAALLAGIQSLLSEVEPDGGADDDRIVSSAEALSMANVWKQIPPVELANSLADCHRSSVGLFLSGIPREYAGEVSFQLVLLEAAAEKEVGVSVSGYGRNLVSGFTASERIGLTGSRPDPFSADVSTYWRWIKENRPRLSGSVFFLDANGNVLTQLPEPTGDFHQRFMRAIAEARRVNVARERVREEESRNRN